MNEETGETEAIEVTGAKEVAIEATEVATGGIEAAIGPIGEKEGPHVRVELIGENEDRPVLIATTLANAKVELTNAPTKAS